MCRRLAQHVLGLLAFCIVLHCCTGTFLRARGHLHLRAKQAESVLNPLAAAVEHIEGHTTDAEHSPRTTLEEAMRNFKAAPSHISQVSKNIFAHAGDYIKRGGAALDDLVQRGKGTYEDTLAHAAKISPHSMLPDAPLPAGLNLPPAIAAPADLFSPLDKPPNLDSDYLRRMGEAIQNATAMQQAGSNVNITGALHPGEEWKDVNPPMNRKQLPPYEHTAEGEPLANPLNEMTTGMFVPMKQVMPEGELETKYGLDVVSGTHNASQAGQEHGPMPIDNENPLQLYPNTGISNQSASNLQAEQQMGQLNRQEAQQNQQAGQRGMAARLLGRLMGQSPAPQQPPANVLGPGHVGAGGPAATPSLPSPSTTPPSPSPSTALPTPSPASTTQRVVPPVTQGQPQTPPTTAVQQAHAPTGTTGMVPS